MALPATKLEWPVHEARAPEADFADTAWPAEPARDSLAAAILERLPEGERRLLVTAGARGEGASTAAVELGLSLARSGRRVLLVDADPLEPVLHARLGRPHVRGLADLLLEIYLGEFGPNDTPPLGTGDWLELVRAQGRSGELTITADAATVVARVLRGRVWCLAAPPGTDEFALGSLLVRGRLLTERQRDEALELQRQHRRPLGRVLEDLESVARPDLERALREQSRQRLLRLLACDRTQCAFRDEPDAPGEAVLAGTPGAADVERLLEGRLAADLPAPFLSARLPMYVTHGEPAGLDLLAAGPEPGEWLAARNARAVSFLLRRLARAYDVVLVDAPPVGPAAPAASLVALARQGLLVVKAGGADVDCLRRAIDELAHAGGSLLGAVLNQAPVARATGLPGVALAAVARDRARLPV